MSKKMWRTITLRVLVGTILLIAGLAAATAKPAQAYRMIVNTLADNPAPICPSPYDFNAKTGKCDAPLPKVDVTVLGVRASASDIDTGSVTILADMNLRAGVKVNSPKCFWTKPGQVWYSGGWGVDGKRFDKETTPGKLCPSPKSSTHWVKVAGGKTGRPCFNEAKVGKAPGQVVHGRILWVSSLARVQMHLHAEAHAVAQSKDCPGTWAEGKGSADITVKLKDYVRSKGPLFVQISGSASGKATANASAGVQCAPAVTTVVTTPAPPAQTVTTVTSVPQTTTVVTTTTVPKTTTVVTTTTTTTPTTTTQPKSNTDLCINIDGVQTALPVGYRKDPPDPGVPGNCYYVGP